MGEGKPQRHLLFRVAPPTGSGGGRARAKSLPDPRGSRDPALPTPQHRQNHTHTGSAPSFPSPDRDQSQVKGLRAGGRGSAELLSEPRAPRACSPLRALTAPLPHAHCRAHARAQGDIHPHTRARVHASGTPRGPAAPAPPLLQPPGNGQAAT